ncbi:hypothetical protein NUU61_000258 [Penicillium alfredii]|uniref:C2H2-type domain-containing protein n=1 Tax=Penicillium alfredii TaxID=1506179 RepID=A0A9W9G9N0_9EURO|nr:uncharacterized protein NUU61_000258 [Penicillium alfredii]KAJ5114499.1 hypothetical protein NUU61_000258 [Penicillium alfredii]
MLAVDPARLKQSYYQAMDPTLVDIFPFPVDSAPQYAPTLTRVSQPFYDTPSVYESDVHNPSNFSSMPATPPLSSGPSIASASSSAIGSPYSGTAQAFQDNWVNTNHGLGLPTAVMNDLFPNEFVGSTVDLDGLYQEKFPDTFVDPSLIQPVQSGPGFSPPTISYPEQPNPPYSAVPPNFIPQSPAASPVPYSDNAEPHPSPRLHPGSRSGPSPLMMHANSHSRPVSVYDRRSSISSIRSRHSQHSPALSSIDADDETKEKGRCPHPDCGRIFKDLKAHMLTHQSERPEKCPIVTCEYHTKGFARKYDKNRHTLTHYKGTMVCGFCPGSGSPAEKSFNRADVFKRHLTAVHGVEQTPPNCRKRSPTGSTKRGMNYGSDATGKCSTCSATFSNAQDFYEHLDDCVLRVVQQEEPSEAINQQRLAEVASDEEVQKTMEKHQLVDAAGSSVDPFDEHDDDDDHDSHDPASWRSGRGGLKSSKGATGSSAGSSRAIIRTGSAVSKQSSSSAATKAPRAVATRRRNNRGNYPQSWGCPNSSMKTKKRVLCVFDGQRRLSVSVSPAPPVPPHRDAYVTDLDVETMKRAEGVLSASDAERGPWIDGPSPHLMGQPAMLLPELGHSHDDEVSLNELMA